MLLPAILFYTEDAQVYQAMLTVADGDYLHSSLW